jgi:hypothetical protein
VLAACSGVLAYAPPVLTNTAAGVEGNSAQPNELRAPSSRRTADPRTSSGCRVRRRVQVVARSVGVSVGAVVLTCCVAQLWTSRACVMAGTSGGYHIMAACGACCNAAHGTQALSQVQNSLFSRSRLSANVRCIRFLFETARR